MAKIENEILNSKHIVNYFQNLGKIRVITEMHNVELLYGTDHMNMFNSIFQVNVANLFKTK